MLLTAKIDYGNSTPQPHLAFENVHITLVGNKP